MKTILVGINAKFIHSNLAIRYIKKYVLSLDSSINIDFAEFTINQSVGFIIKEIIKQHPSKIGFSCYIWNIDMVKQIITEIKKIDPSLYIFVGGPEVSFGDVDLNCDCVVTGEGEQAVYELVSKSNEQLLSENVQTEPFSCATVVGKPVDMDAIPFVYENFDDLQNRIIYYEASRGCPFKCQYCLSGSNGKVRFRSIEKVENELKFFLDNNVRQVKFVDRTFNTDKKYAMKIFDFIEKYDNGITNFHFEIAAELLDNDMLERLSTIRKGLVQFEIGVQSTNKKTLEAIKRVTLPEKLTPVISKLQKNKNIHLHLDLIAGLPYEGMVEFEQSFNYVYGLRPDQFQLGFLKLLKGAGLYDKKDEYGIVVTDYPPYEVLKTNSLSYQEILVLKSIDDMVDTYYNSNRYKMTLLYLEQFFSNPFLMYKELGEFYEQNDYHLAPHAKHEYYTIIKNFMVHKNLGDINELKYRVLFDSYSHEKAKRLPEWVDVSSYASIKNEALAFYSNEENVDKYLPQYKGYDSKQLLRNAHIDEFPFDLEGKANKTTILFNYKETDILGNAKCYKIY